MEFIFIIKIKLVPANCFKEQNYWSLLIFQNEHSSIVCEDKKRSLIKNKAAFVTGNIWWVIYIFYLKFLSYSFVKSFCKISISTFEYTKSGY